MLNTLKSLFAADTAETDPVFADERLAVAALLTEAACADENYDAAERTTIIRLLAAHFDISESEASDLADKAHDHQQSSVQIFRYTSTAKDATTPEERIALIEMLWEVVYADGEIDDFESNLMRRLGGLLHITDRDRGAARKRVLARLDRSDV